ncbi:MAG: type III restriction endonuclease subunit R, partial [Clostridia bacterium]|nr:type III restriction endonuclease subunit R [Clostridia bacterium]
LETVQGDERDTIIFSVGYAKDDEGKLLHNFGPLNRVGGERRLNVAVTRAKHNVQVVASMKYTAIDLKRTKSAGARLLRDYLDYAENGSAALERTTEGGFEKPRLELQKEVCEFLNANGFIADMQVGCSGMKIDVAVKDKNGADYVLAVECDGESYHSSRSARDRDRLRREVLERMGWRFYRIWSADWVRSNKAEKERLLYEAEAAVNGKGKPSLSSKQPHSE